MKPMTELPPRRGIYYGWLMVAVASVAMAATLPGRTHGLGLITKRMLEELAVSRESFAWMNFAATLLGALFCLPCGWLIDRWGIKTLLAATVAALGLNVLWMTTVNDPTSLAVAVTLSRGLGQSMLSVISIAIVARWFQRRLGPAMGAYSVGLSLLMAIATGVVGALIQQYDWRQGWSMLGWSLLAIAPVLWLVAASDPRDRSLEFSASTAGDAKPADAGPTWLAAIATPCFWIFSLSISFFGLISAGLSLFQQYVLEERGFNETVFQTVLVIGLLVGMLTNLVAGWLVQRRSLPRMLSVAMLLLALSLSAFPFITQLWQVYTYAVVQGIAGGMLTVLFFSVWGKAFAGAQLGRIQAAAQMMTVLASASGPLLVEWSRVASGSYLQVFAVSACVALSMAVVAWLTPLPRFDTAPALQLAQS